MMLALSGKPFSGDRLLAQQLAQDYGLRCIEPRVVIERAAARGVPHSLLWDALLRPPRLSDRLFHKGRVPLILLQAALAEEIRAGAGVCWGRIAVLLPMHQRPSLIRVEVHAPMEVRVATAREQLKLSRSEAIDLVERQDHEREQWMRHVHGVGAADTAAYDIVVNLDHMDSREVCALLSQLAQKRQTDQIHLDDIALACNVKAALVLNSATSHLDLDAAASSGIVSLSGKVPITTDLEAAKRAVVQVHGVTAVQTERIRIPSNEGLPAPTAPFPGFRKLWPAWAAIGALLCVAIVWPLGERPPTVFAGYITDTECGSRVEHGMDADCIRTCVKNNGAVKYALYDGKNLYTLSDQSAPALFAAEHVQVTGELDAGRAVLEVKSIRPML